MTTTEAQAKTIDGRARTLRELLDKAKYAIDFYQPSPTRNPEEPKRNGREAGTKGTICGASVTRPRAARRVAATLLWRI